ncbi:ATP-binding protein [Labrenzia sp. 011]|uniref:ATP-binding protein n=1 Tax=Labrenzia sp. 011 TaxID=2171494 RepID=UPI0014028BE8|nr:ATP-binding protein [Labrenzia sp. 011]
MFWRKLSLTSKLFIAIGATSATIVAAMALLVVMSMREGFAQYVLQEEIGRLQSLEQALTASYDPENPGWPDLVASHASWHEFVVDNFRTGEPRHPPAGAEGPMPPGPRPAFDLKQLSDRIILLDANGEILIGSAPSGTRFAKRPIPAPDNADSTTGASSRPLGWLGMTAPLGGAGPADAVFLEGQTKSLIVVSVAAIALSLIAAFVLARQILTPVNLLAEGANALADGRFATRIVNNRQDELGALIDDFNSLAENLENKEKAERLWVSNTSHELQTPVSLLRAEIEALQDGIRKPDPKTLAGLHASVMRLSALVHDLNSLARTQEGHIEIDPNRHDLSKLVNEAVERARLRIEKEGLTLTLFLEPGVSIACDPTRIGQLLDNLLENSRRYTDAPGQIQIQASVSDHRAKLVIEDTSPSPARTSMPKLFQRFYREETSRSRVFGGSGLGLSICETIVAAHGGTIAASFSDLGGLRIALTLPLHSAQLQDLRNA